MVSILPQISSSFRLFFTGFQYKLVSQLVSSIDITVTLIFVRLSIFFYFQFNSLWVFHIHVTVSYFYWNDKSQVIRTRLRFLAFLNNVVVRIISMFLWFPIPPVPFQSLWGSFQIHQLQFVFHCIFSSLTNSKYLSIISFSFIFAGWSAITVKSTRRLNFFLFFFFLLINTSLVY